jgi:hypothetical protein
MEGFDQFWAIYPLHIAKKTAQRAFARALKSASTETILAGARRYRIEKQGSPYIKHPTTWLNGGCWDDEPLPKGHVNGHQRRLDAWDAAYDALGRYAEDLRDPGEAAPRMLPTKGGR